MHNTTKTTNPKILQFLGAAIHSGQNLSGVEEGPLAIRNSGLFQSVSSKYQIQISDHGDINLESLGQKNMADQEFYKNKKVKNLHLLDPMLQMISKKVSNIINKENSEQRLMLTVGGDHSVATGSIHGLLTKYKDLKVVWVDAHPDFINSGISEYEGYHGMPLSHLVGINDQYIGGFKWLVNKLPPQNIVLIGIRDIDEDQWISLKKYNIKCFTPDHIDMYGIGKVMDMAIQYLDPKLQNKISAPFHISFDIDAMDPSIAGGTGTKFRDGLSHREGCHIIKRIAHQKRLVGLDIVEINPKLEEKKIRKNYRGQDSYKQIGETVGLGVDLIESVFTKYLTL